MPKKRKQTGGWESFDNFDDFMDAIHQRAAGTTSASEMDAEPDVAKISLKDFIINDKVSAFQHDYEPCGEFDAGAERFGDGELRTYFKAYVTGLGDPLALYIEDLKLAGFKMVTSLANNKPAIFARLKFH